MKNKLLLLIIFSIILLFLGNQVLAVKTKEDFPRLVNHFLKWEINDYEVNELAKWDFLILDMETQINSPDKIIKIRQLNPDIIILAYITSQEILDDIYRYPRACLRQEFYQNLDDSWWLTSLEGEKISYWPNTFMLNVSDGAGLDKNGERYNDYLPRFVVEKIKSSQLWDGVFYDNTWGDVAWINGGNLDILKDKQENDNYKIDQLWSSGFKKILEKTRQLAGIF